MSVHTKKHITLISEVRNIIVGGEWLTDVHIEHFQNLLRNCSEYTPGEYNFSILYNQYRQIKSIYKYYTVHLVHQMDIGCVVITIEKIYLYMIL